MTAHILKVKIETIIMGIWLYVMKPESDVGLKIFQGTLALFEINLFLGLLLYFLKKPSHLLFFALWIMWFTYYA
jgi:hypothetical protein